MQCDGCDGDDGAVATMASGRRVECSNFVSRVGFVANVGRMRKLDAMAQSNSLSFFENFHQLRNWRYTNCAFCRSRVHRRLAPIVRNAHGIPVFLRTWCDMMCVQILDALQSRLPPVIGDADLGNS